MSLVLSQENDLFVLKNHSNPYFCRRQDDDKIPNKDNFDALKYFAKYKLLSKAMINLQESKSKTVNVLI